MTARPINGAIGVEIMGLSLSQANVSFHLETLCDYLSIHHLIVIRQQFLQIPTQLALTAALGPVLQLPYIKPHPDYADVISVHKRKEDVRSGVFGGEWHSDFSFLADPPAGSILNAVKVPETGGDTLWANQVLAYQHLPTDLKALVDQHKAVHVGKPYGVKHAPPESQRAGGGVTMTRDDPNADREMLHPCVHEDPQTGERALWLNPIYTTRFEHLSEVESQPLLQQIYWHATRPDFCCRHRWQAGDLIIWNNFTTLHYATNDYDGQERLLYRTTFGK